MKQFLLLLAALPLFSAALHAQNSGLQDFVDRHKKDPAFTFAFVSKDLLETATQQNIEEKDWKRVQNVVRNIGSLTILASDHQKDAPALYKEARDLVQEQSLDELLTVRDNQDNVRIWVKDDAQNTLTDLVLLVGSPEEFVLVSFTGALDLENIGELARLFDAEQAKDLARTAAAVAIDFQITPNPSAGEIALNYAGQEGDLPMQLSVSDNNGRQVALLQLSPEPTQSIQLQGLQNGMYWVQLKTTKGKVGIKPLQIIKK